MYVQQHGIENSPEELSCCEKASPTESVETAKDDTTAKVKLADSQDMSAKKNKYALASNKTNYTKGQVEVLMQFFQQTPYPDSEMLEDIGKSIGVTERNVKIWFQNKRARCKGRNNDLNGHIMYPQMQSMLPPVTAWSMPNAMLPPVAQSQQYPGYQQYSPTYYNNRYQNLASSAPDMSMLIQGPQFTPNGNAKNVSPQSAVVQSSFGMPIALESSVISSILPIDNSELHQSHSFPFSSASHQMKSSQFITGPRQQMPLSPYVPEPKVPPQQMPLSQYMASTSATEQQTFYQPLYNGY